MNKKRNLFLLVPLVFCLTSFCSIEKGQKGVKYIDFESAKKSIEQDENERALELCNIQPGSLFRTDKTHLIEKVNGILDKIVFIKQKEVKPSTISRTFQAPFSFVRKLVSKKNIGNETSELLILKDKLFNLIGDEDSWKLSDKKWKKSLIPGVQRCLLRDSPVFIESKGQFENCCQLILVEQDFSFLKHFYEKRVKKFDKKYNFSLGDYTYNFPVFIERQKKFINKLNEQYENTNFFS